MEPLRLTRPEDIVGSEAWDYLTPEERLAHADQYEKDALNLGRNNSIQDGDGNPLNFENKGADANEANRAYLYSEPYKNYVSEQAQKIRDHAYLGREQAMVTNPDGSVEFNPDTQNAIAQRKMQIDMEQRLKSGALKEFDNFLYGDVKDSITRKEREDFITQQTGGGSNMDYINGRIASYEKDTGKKLSDDQKRDIRSDAQRRYSDDRFFGNERIKQTEDGQYIMNPKMAGDVNASMEAIDNLQIPDVEKQNLKRSYKSKFDGFFRNLINRTTQEQAANAGTLGGGGFAQSFLTGATGVGGLAVGSDSNPLDVIQKMIEDSPDNMSAWRDIQSALGDNKSTLEEFATAAAVGANKFALNSTTSLLQGLDAVPRTWGSMLKSAGAEGAGEFWQDTGSNIDAATRGTQGLLSEASGQLTEGAAAQSERLDQSGQALDVLGVKVNAQKIGDLYSQIAGAMLSPGSTLGSIGLATANAMGQDYTEKFNQLKELGYDDEGADKQATNAMLISGVVNGGSGLLLGKLASTIGKNVVSPAVRKFIPSIVGGAESSSSGLGQAITGNRIARAVTAGTGNLLDDEAIGVLKKALGDFGKVKASTMAKIGLTNLGLNVAEEAIEEPFAQLAQSFGNFYAAKFGGLDQRISDKDLEQALNASALWEQALLGGIGGAGGGSVGTTTEILGAQEFMQKAADYSKSQEFKNIVDRIPGIAKSTAADLGVAVNPEGRAVYEAPGTDIHGTEISPQTRSLFSDRLQQNLEAQGLTQTSQALRNFQEVSTQRDAEEAAAKLRTGVEQAESATKKTEAPAPLVTPPAESVSTSKVTESSNPEADHLLGAPAANTSYDNDLQLEVKNVPGVGNVVFESGRPTNRVVESGNPRAATETETQAIRKKLGAVLDVQSLQRVNTEDKKAPANPVEAALNQIQNPSNESTAETKKVPAQPATQGDKSLQVAGKESVASLQQGGQSAAKANDGGAVVASGVQADAEAATNPPAKEDNTKDQPGPTAANTGGENVGKNSVTNNERVSGGEEKQQGQAGTGNQAKTAQAPAAQANPAEEEFDEDDFSADPYSLQSAAQPGTGSVDAAKVEKVRQVDAQDSSQAGVPGIDIVRMNPQQAQRFVQPQDKKATAPDQKGLSYYDNGKAESQDGKQLPGSLLVVETGNLDEKRQPITEEYVVASVKELPNGQRRHYLVKANKQQLEATQQGRKAGEIAKRTEDPAARKLVNKAMAEGVIKPSDLETFVRDTLAEILGGNTQLADQYLQKEGATNGFRVWRGDGGRVWITQDIAGLHKDLAKVIAVFQGDEQSLVNDMADDFGMYVRTMLREEANHLAALQAVPDEQIYQMVDALNSLMTAARKDGRSRFDEGLLQFHAERALGNPIAREDLPSVIAAMNEEQKFFLGHEYLADLNSMVKNGIRTINAYDFLLKWAGISSDLKRNKQSGTVRAFKRLLEVGKRYALALKNQLIGNSIIQQAHPSVLANLATIDQMLASMSNQTPAPVQDRLLDPYQSRQAFIEDQMRQANDVWDFDYDQDTINAQQELRNFISSIEDLPGVKISNLVALKRSKDGSYVLRTTPEAAEFLQDRSSQLDSILNKLNGTKRIGQIVQIGQRISLAHEAATRDVADLLQESDTAFSKEVTVGGKVGRKVDTQGRFDDEASRVDGFESRRENKVTENELYSRLLEANGIYVSPFMLEGMMMNQRATMENSQRVMQMDEATEQMRSFMKGWPTDTKGILERVKKEYPSNPNAQQALADNMQQALAANAALDRANKLTQDANDLYKAVEEKQAAIKDRVASGEVVESITAEDWTNYNAKSAQARQARYEAQNEVRKVINHAQENNLFKSQEEFQQISDTLNLRPVTNAEVGFQVIDRLAEEQRVEVNRGLMMSRASDIRNFVNSRQLAVEYRRSLSDMILNLGQRQRIKDQVRQESGLFRMEQTPSPLSNRLIAEASGVITEDLRDLYTGDELNQILNNQLQGVGMEKFAVEPSSAGDAAQVDRSVITNRAITAARDSVQELIHGRMNGMAPDMTDQIEVTRGFQSIEVINEIPYQDADGETINQTFRSWKTADRLFVLPENIGTETRGISRGAAVFLANAEERRAMLAEVKRFLDGFSGESPTANAVQSVPVARLVDGQTQMYDRLTPAGVVLNMVSPSYVALKELSRTADEMIAAGSHLKNNSFTKEFIDLGNRIEQTRRNLRTLMNSGNAVFKTSEDMARRERDRINSYTANQEESENLPIDLNVMSSIRFNFDLQRIKHLEGQLEGGQPVTVQQLVTPMSAKAWLRSYESVSNQMRTPTVQTVGQTTYLQEGYREDITEDNAFPELDGWELERAQRVESENKRRMNRIRTVGLMSLLGFNQDNVSKFLEQPQFSYVSELEGGKRIYREDAINSWLLERMQEAARQESIDTYGQMVADLESYPSNPERDTKVKQLKDLFNSSREFTVQSLGDAVSDSQVQAMHNHSDPENRPLAIALSLGNTNLVVTDNPEFARFTFIAGATPVLVFNPRSANTAIRDVMGQQIQHFMQNADEAQRIRMNTAVAMAITPIVANTHGDRFLNEAISRINSPLDSSMEDVMFTEVEAKRQALRQTFDQAIAEASDNFSGAVAIPTVNEMAAFLKEPTDQQAARILTAMLSFPRFAAILSQNFDGDIGVGSFSGVRAVMGQVVTSDIFTGAKTDAYANAVLRSENLDEEAEEESYDSLQELLDSEHKEETGTNIEDNAAWMIDQINSAIYGAIDALKAPTQSAAPQAATLAQSRAAQDESDLAKAQYAALIGPTAAAEKGIETQLRARSADYKFRRLNVQDFLYRNNPFSDQFDENRRLTGERTLVSDMFGSLPQIDASMENVARIVKELGYEIPDGQIEKIYQMAAQAEQAATEDGLAALKRMEGLRLTSERSQRTLQQLNDFAAGNESTEFRTIDMMEFLSGYERDFKPRKLAETIVRNAINDTLLEGKLEQRTSELRDRVATENLFQKVLQFQAAQDSYFDLYQRLTRSYNNALGTSTDGRGVPKLRQLLTPEEKMVFDEQWMALTAASKALNSSIANIDKARNAFAPEMAFSAFEVGNAYARTYDFSEILDQAEQLEEAKAYASPDLVGRIVRDTLNTRDAASLLEEADQITRMVRQAVNQGASSERAITLVKNIIAERYGDTSKSERDAKINQYRDELNGRILAGSRDVKSIVNEMIADARRDLKVNGETARDMVIQAIRKSGIETLEQLDRDKNEVLKQVERSNNETLKRVYQTNSVNEQGFRRSIPVSPFNSNAEIKAFQHTLNYLNENVFEKNYRIVQKRNRGVALGSDQFQKNVSAAMRGEIELAESIFGDQFTLADNVLIPRTVQNRMAAFLSSNGVAPTPANLGKASAIALAAANNLDPFADNFEPEKQSGFAENIINGLSTANLLPHNSNASSQLRAALNFLAQQVIGQNPYPEVVDGAKKAIQAINGMTPDEQIKKIWPLFSDVYSKAQAIAHASSLASGMTNSSVIDAMRDYLHHDASIRAYFGKDINSQKIAKRFLGLVDNGLTGSGGRQGYRAQKMHYDELLNNLFKGKSDQANSLGYLVAMIHSQLKALEKRNIDIRTKKIGGREGDGLDNLRNLIGRLDEAVVSHRARAIGRKVSVANKKGLAKVAAGLYRYSGIEAAYDTLFREDPSRFHEADMADHNLNIIRPAINQFLNGSKPISADAVKKDLLDHIEKEWESKLKRGVKQVVRRRKNHGQTREVADGIEKIFGDLAAEYRAVARMTGTETDFTYTPDVPIPFDQYRELGDVGFRGDDTMQVSTLDQLGLDKGVWNAHPFRKNSKFYKNILSVHGYRSAARAVNDMTYRMNVQPAYSVFQDIVGSATQDPIRGRLVLQSGIPSSVQDYSNKPNSQGDYINADREEMQAGIARVSLLGQETIGNDFNNGIAPSRFTQLVGLAAKAGVVRTLGSLSQKWKQTIPAVTGYALRGIASGNPGILSAWPQYILGNMPGMTNTKLGKQAKAIDQIIRDNALRVYLRGADGSEEAGRQIRYSANRPKGYQVDQIRKARTAQEKLRQTAHLFRSIAEVGLQNTAYGLDLAASKILEHLIAKPELSVVRSIYMNELKKALATKVQFAGKKPTIQDVIDNQDLLNFFDHQMAGLGVEDIMAQSDQSHKAKVMQRSPNIAKEAIRQSIFTFANHQMSLAANSAAAGIMIKEGNAETKKAGAALLLTNVYQNVAYTMLGLSTISALGGSLLRAAGLKDDDDISGAFDWMFPTKPATSKTGLAWDIFRASLTGETRPDGYNAKTGQYEDKRKDLDMARVLARSGQELANQFPMTAPFTANRIGSELLGTLSEKATAAIMDVDFPKYERAGVATSKETEAATAAVNNYGQYAGYFGLEAATVADNMAFLANADGVDELDFLARWALSHIGTREAANIYDRYVQGRGATLRTWRSQSKKMAAQREAEEQ